MAYSYRRRGAYRKRRPYKRAYRKRTYRKRTYRKRTYRKATYRKRYSKKRVAVLRPDRKLPLTKWTVDHLPTEVKSYSAFIRQAADKVVANTVVKMETDPVVDGRTERQVMKDMSEGVVFVG